MFKKSAALVALCLFAQAAQADQIPGSAKTVAAWKVAAYEKNVKFSHCAMTMPYRSGITMIFSVSGNHSWRVGWKHSSWNFTKGQSVDLVLFVDDVGPHSLRATAATEKMALAELPAKAAVFDLMRKGNRMTVRAMGNTYAFNLDGTYPALTEILTCATQYNGVAAAPSAPPPPIASAPPSMIPAPAGMAPLKPSGDVTAEQRLEATKVVANILAQGEMTGFRI